MKELLCPVCREQMTFSAIGDLARCKYCDAVVSATESEEYYSNINTISFSIKEKNFSEGVYLSKQMLQDDHKDSLSSWLMFLCKYGISYMKTPLSSKKVPSFSKDIEKVNFYDDEDFKNAIALESIEEIKNYYNNQVDLISQLYEKISVLTSRCKYNDIYICAKRYNQYKTNDGKIVSEFTDDYKKALQTYEYLKNIGYNVFFSPIDAKNTIDELEFSAIIHSSIYQSKVFLLFASKIEYIEAPSIKSDWFKYVFFMRNKLVPPNSLFLMYQSKNSKMPYILPQELHSCKAFNYLDPRHLDLLLPYIKEIVPDNTKLIQAKRVSLSNDSFHKNTRDIVKKSFIDEKPIPDDEKNIINLGIKYLRNKEFDKAYEIFDQLKDLNDKNFMCIFGKILSQTKSCGLSDLTIEKLFSLDSFNDLEEALNLVDKINGKKIIDKICLQLKMASPSKADSVVWVYYIIAPYLDENQKITLVNSLALLQEIFIKKNAIKESGKIFGLICNLTNNSPKEENSKYYKYYINSLMQKRQFKICRNVLIEFVKTYETPEALLNLLKCSLKTNTFDNFVFKYKPNKNINKECSFSPNEIIPRIVTVSFYFNSIKPIEELRKICYTQIEHYNFQTADYLINDIISYMLPLYPSDVVTRFILKCSNKFSNSGAFDYAIKYSELVKKFDDKNCYAYFEILRASMKSYDDYDFINYEGNIKELPEYKSMIDVATKTNNTSFIKKIESLLQYQSQPKKMKTKKGFPRKNFKNKLLHYFIKFLKYFLSIILVLSILVIIFMSKK